MCNCFDLINAIIKSEAAKHKDLFEAAMDKTNQVS